jgi:hypothetical protein
MFLINPYILQSGSSYSPLTQALLDNGIETNTTYLDAINTLENKWTTSGMINNFLSMQLFLGSDSTKCAYDFINGTYGTFSGTWTFDSKGVKGNGVNTNFSDGITSNQLGENKGFYVLTNNFDSTTTAFDFGNNDNKIMTTFAYSGAYTAYSRVSSSSYITKTSQGTSLGTHLGYRNSSANHKLIDVNEVVTTGSHAYTATDSSLLYLGTGAGGYSDRQYGILAKGDASLSDAEALELWNDINDLNAIIHP